MKQIFNKIDKMSVFEEKIPCNIRELQIVIDNIWKEKWKNNVPFKPKLRTYMSFKEQYCTEEYVKFCIPRKERSLLAQIRFGTLPLHIETGRFRGTILEERTCQICNSCAIEDEFHFISVCNEYKELRIDLYNSIKYKVETFEHFNNREKFVHIMKHEWKLLSKYLVRAWEKRNNKLNITIMIN